MKNKAYKLISDTFGVFSKTNHGIAEITVVLEDIMRWIEDSKVKLDMFEQAILTAPYTFEEGAPSESEHIRARLEQAKSVYDVYSAAATKAVQ